MLRASGRVCAFCLVAVLLHVEPVVARVLINEIHYHPEPKTELAEFIELYNSGPDPVNLSGWQISGGISFLIPNGTTISSNGYLVIAQSPSTILSKYSINALGPWTGLLNNTGDKVTLLNVSGLVEDEVSYQLGFPWPTVGDPPGYSIELIHPSLDTSLGGSWRASVAGNPIQQTNILILDHAAGWKYFKGLTEASSPTTDWRLLGFPDSTWSSGTAPVGYDASLAMGTKFSDMNGYYTSFFLRKELVVADPAAVSSLRLEALYDDGFKLWINGTNVLNQSLPTNEVPYSATSTGGARESNAYDTFNLNSPGRYLRAGTNILAVQVHNCLLTNSSDCFFDCRLSALFGPAAYGPTPGRINSVFATNAPPQIRQVDHSPNAPRSGQPVSISAKVTDPDGVQGVSLQYQVVEPGFYIALTNSIYATNWTTVPMNDRGIDGDTQAGDSVYTATVPASIQQHRRLIRYRIRASDPDGMTVTVPYSDDPQPNFAYFCYDGIPAWQAAVQPGVTPVTAFDTNVMGHLPAVHLIATKTDAENATWFSRYTGDAYPWLGTLVYDGKVYDHIHFRARGGGWRYAMTKNMWKFDLNRGHDLEMRDDYGKKFSVGWTKLNLGACIQQGDYDHRGEQGMFESVGFRLFNMAGVEAPKTTYLQFRVIDEAPEAPVDQYEGDFWGLYLGVEQEDGRFLDEHNLPDGNFYKMESGTGTPNNIGLAGPVDGSDLSSFLSTYRASSPAASEQWWRTNLNLQNYWSYQAVVQGIHHYDICYDKNYFYYRNPLTGLWSVHSWDLDLTWANNMYDVGCGGIDDLYYPVFGGGSAGYPAKAAMTMEYRNRVREIRDLLFNPEQAGQLIEECAYLLRGPQATVTFLDADRCKWDYNPKMTNSAYTTSPVNKAGQGRYYRWQREPSVSKDFAGCVQLMKDYVVVRGAVLDNLAADSQVPAQPSLAYLGPPGYPLNRLSFRSSEFSGFSTFAALQWRVAEVTDTNAPAYDPTEPRAYEIAPVFQTGELVAWSSDWTAPSASLKPGHTYRVRVRHEDSTGRWSRWSAPAQFVADVPDTAAALVSDLRLTELMYDPPAGSDYEFIELRNTGDSLSLDLSGAKFTSGVDFTFPQGTSLLPGEYLLVTRATNESTFRSYYNLGASVKICGPYLGSLANSGEQLTLKVSAGGNEIASFDFGQGRGWPVGAQGAGHSLVPLDRAIPFEATGTLDYPGNWRASSRLGGSPGEADPAPRIPAVLINEVTAHTDYADPLRPEYDSNDWIELYNSTGTNVSLANYYLSDDPANPRKWPIPARTVSARGHIVLDEVHDFHNPITSGFGIDKAGEQILLSRFDGGSNDGVVDAIQFGGQENERSIGRYPDGSAWWFTMLRTSNSVNSAGIPGVVISEFMYHPPDIAGLDNTRDEFVELFNPMGSTVTLQDTNGVWRLSGGIAFSFPLNTVIPAGGTLLVVNFDPADATALANFKTLYHITNAAVPVLGPYAGKLSNRSDRVALEKPQYPDLVGDPYSWIILDEVIYGNQDPWPASANGLGFALQRISTNRNGNDPANWLAASPNPGYATSAPSDSDADGMPDAWETLHGLNPFDASDATLDLDHDGMSNLAEYLSGTNPADANSVLKLQPSILADGTVLLRFNAAESLSYTIQFKSDVAGALWDKLADVPAGAARAVQVPDDAPFDFSTRFYRIVTPALP